MTRTPRPIDVAPLRRYAPLVDDLDAFLTASQRPLPRVVWANPLRASAERVEAAVRERCPDAVPIPWMPGAWRLPGKVRPGRWPAYQFGWLHGQEEAALWAVDALDVAPGMRVADLCASPGNKAAQIAVRMQDRGMLLANEAKVGRLAPLRFNLERLGVSCAVVTQLDGAHVPEVPGGFDRVLADVPCSCEGTTRKGTLVHRDPEHRFKVQQVQVSVLRRALALTRPGGIVVYATCTYAPEENEGVLDAIDPALASVEPFEAPAGLRVDPGVGAWDGREYRDDVAHAARVWPHHNDTGGFFVARLRRL